MCDCEKKAIKVKMQLVSRTILIAAVCAIFSVNAFDDPISVLGRIRWNYTSYEENLWTRQFKNTTLEQIYQDHSGFIDAINKVYDVNDHFYPIINGSANFTSIRQIPFVDAFLINPYHVPIVHDVILSNAQVEEYWRKFANWSSYNATNMLDVLTDDAIPTLQNALNTMWNTTNTVIYFDFLINKSNGCSDMNQSELADYKITEKYFINTMFVQLKSYIMLQLSYLTRATKDFVHFHKSARDQRILFNSQYAEFTRQSENLMWNLSRIVWSCDDFHSNESYTQLTNFLQGYVDNQINLNADGTCSAYCTDYKVTKNYGCKPGTLCNRNYLDHNKTVCSGTVRDCDYFGPTFTFCPNEDDSEPNRRIDFVKLGGSEKILGKEKLPCKDQVEAKPFMTWLSTCRYCFCLCDAPGPNSHRYFSLRDVMSSIAENKVISGVRLVKLNGIIHLTAIERTLLPNGQLEPKIEKLVTNYTFSIDSPNVKKDSDYFELTYLNRTLNLDTIVAARDQVVTGVRFRVHSGSLHLEVRFTYFDEITGKLDLTTASEWKMNSNTKRSLIPSDHLGIPTESNKQSRALGTENQNAVRFGPTGWMRDMAQTTVPFIDTILVKPDDLTPLSGVGLFYKYQLGHGGYVSPRIVIHDNAAAAMRIRAAAGVYGV